MQTGKARGGIADGLMIASRYDDGVVVVDKATGQAELYVMQYGDFYPKWNATREVDWEKLDKTVDGPQYDVIAHPKAGE